MPLTTRSGEWSAGRLAVAAGALIVLWGLGARVANAATIDVPANQPTIKAAIAAASSGDVIRVAAGTYMENDISFGSKNLVLESVSGPAVTIIDANQAERVFHLISGSLTRAAVIDGFTIRNGKTVSDGGGGLRILNGSPTIRNNIIEDNSTSRGGGGIRVMNGANPLIENNTIRNNIAEQRGGGIEIVSATAEVRGNVFFSNDAIATAGLSSGGGMRVLSATSEVTVSGNRFEQNRGLFSGGGITAIASDVRLVQNEFLGNESATGGGVHLETNTGSFTWTVIDNLFQGNVASQESGGLSLFAAGQAATAFVRDNRFLSNICTNTGCSTGSEGVCCQGGAIRASQGTGTEVYTGNLIEGNQADTYGGVLLLGVAAKTVIFEDNRVESNTAEFVYPGVACVGVSDCTIARNELVGNSTQPAPSSGVSPGALYLKDTLSATVENNFFYDNEGREAGALFAFETSGPMDVVLRNNSFVDNTTLVGARATVYVRSAVSSSQSATVVNNLFEGDVRALYIRNNPALDIRFNDFHGFSTGIYSKEGGSSFTTVAQLNSQAFASGNVSVAPDLAVVGDVHLASTSPLVGLASCADAPAVDIDGESRPLGGGCEIGADEFSVLGLLFRDGFESGGTGQWDFATPP